MPVGSSQFPLAAGFVTPGFFAAGALLASIPIIIHILNRRRFKTVQWAAMEFLLNAMKKNRRRLRFEQWLLLASRCLVLGILGLALARPTGCEDSTIAAVAGQRAGMHVFVIDNSYSMAFEADRTDAKTHLDQAKKLAKQRIDQLSAGGEAVAIITASRPAMAVIARPSYDLEGAKASIDRIQQSQGGTDLFGALQKALEIGRSEMNQPARNLYLLTDSTRSAWETDRADALASLGKELATVYQVSHFNLSKPGQWNHAVLSVTPGSSLIRTEFYNSFDAIIRGYGSESEALMQWRLDDSILPGAKQVRPTLTSRPETQPQVKIGKGGLHVVSSVLNSDNRLKLDDARWRVVDVASEMKVLIVEGERGAGPFGGSGAFLALALAPPSEDGTHIVNAQVRTHSYIIPEVVSDLELGNRVLGEYRAVILTSVSNIAPQQADQLKVFVEQGGTLLYFVGDPVNPDSYNTVLLPRGLLPGPLARRMSATGDQAPFRFDFKPYGSLHPLLKFFKDQERTGLDQAQILGYWKVELPADTKVQTVLSYLPDGQGHQDPAITVHDLGQGRVVFYSTSANTEWNSLTPKPSYVVLMHELLSGSINSNDRWLNIEVGQVVEIPSTIQLTAAPNLKDPLRADVMIDQVQTADGRSVYRSGPVPRAGIYTLTAGDRTYPVAVNLPDDEADIRPLDGPAIQRALGDIKMSLLDDALPPIAAIEQAGSDFGWSVMLIVLTLVGLECFLAMKFGHHKR